MFSQGIPESRERGCGITQAPGRYFALRPSGGGGSWRGKAGSPYRRPAGSAWAKGTVRARDWTFCCLFPLLPAGRRAPTVQSSICPVPIRCTPARMPDSFSGECPTQSTSSPTTRSGSRLRNDCVGFPGNFLSVIGVVFELAGRPDEVDPPGAFTSGEFGSPGRGVERGSERAE